MAEDHKQLHRDNARFSARHAVTHAGMSCSRECAIQSALGLIDGGADELITMLGEAKAYEEIMKVADRVIAKAAEQKTT